MGGFPSDEAMRRALHALPASDPDVWAPILAAVCRKHGIDTPARVSMFLGNIMHESGGLSKLVESLNYGRDRLVGVFGATRGGKAVAAGLGRPPGSKAPLTTEQQQALANCVYGGDWGKRNLGNTGENDGWFFRGKGLIQLTGRANHTKFAKTIGVDVVALQAMLESKEGAAEAAASFWASKNCNACADGGDDAAVRKLVNGGDLGLAEVEHHTAIAAKALA